MPNYDYHCDPEKGGCGHKFEAIQGIHDKPLQECPECGKNKLIKLFGVPGLIFRGTGFYVTDYKNKDKGPDS